MMVPGVTPAVVFELQPCRCERSREFFPHNRRDRAFWHVAFLDGDQIDPTLGSMPASFEYKPRFKDMRIKPPKAGEAEAEADVLRLKPGEKPCDWPDCTKAATAKAPKS